MSLIKTSSSSSERMFSLLKSLSPLQRMVNSPGLDKTFEIIKSELPGITVHEYQAGMVCEDWIVPSSWSVVEGYMKDEKGNVIASIEEDFLFVASYSEPVDGWFSKDEIEKHLSTRPENPDAFVLEHRNTYNYQLVDWGISLPYRRWVNLPEGKYHIKIKTNCEQGSMKVGEYFIKGKRKETICINAHIDELCNDDLSGCVVIIELMKFIEQIACRQYSYQMLLLPEMFGPLFFIYNNPEKTKDTIGVLNLETVGAGECLYLKKAFKKDTRIENILRLAMKSKNIAFKEMEFFEGYVNDERVYAWPSIDIDGVGIQRFPFAEYHTSDDTIQIINKEYLSEALDIAKLFIRIMEEDYVPQYTNKLQPWLTRRGLYYDSKRDSQNYHKFNNSLLFNVNGETSVSELAEKGNLDFFAVNKYLNKMLHSNYINQLQVQWNR